MKIISISKDKRFAMITYDSDEYPFMKDIVTGDYTTINNTETYERNKECRKSQLSMGTSPGKKKHLIHHHI